MQDQPLPQLLFKGNRGEIFSKPDDFYRSFRQSSPVVLRIPDNVPDFAFKGSILQFPQMRVSSSASDPCQIETRFTSPWFSLLVPITGQGTIENSHRRMSWKASDNLILNPLKEEQKITFESTRSEILFEIDSSRMLKTLASMQAPGAPLGALTAPHAEIATMTEQQRIAKAHLLSSLSLIDATGQDLEHLSRIGFDDVLMRLVAEMVISSNATQAQADASNSKRSQRALTLICGMITAPDSRPLTMSQMEDATGVTGRALCYAFKERFGCSPQEWQRNHFLDRAHDELCRDGSARSIKSISRKFGFATPYSFTRFYRRRFGQSPADTLKRFSSCLPREANVIDFSI